jgi:hypothetical protein
MDDFATIGNTLLDRVRDLLWQASISHPDLPVSIIVALIAETSMLANEPDVWTADLLAAASECRDLKMQAIMEERQHAALN